MNTFFKSFFASLLALLVFSILVLVTLGGLVTALSRSFEKESAVVEPNSVLYLDVNLPLTEQTSYDLNFSMLAGDNWQPAYGLNDVLAVIKTAATDPNIKGIVINMGLNMNGYGTLEAVREALDSFQKESGKFVYAYGEMVNQPSYYLGSVAQQVYLNPAGVLEFKGLAANLLFVKGTLDKLGIRTQVYWAGEFKSATEPLRLDKMSEQNRNQLREYLEGLYTAMLSDMSASRNIPADSLRRVAGRMDTWLPGGAVQAGLVQKLLYQDEFESLLRQKLGLGNEAEIPAVTLTEYLPQVPKQEGNWDRQIAVVYAEGSIVDGEGENGSIGSSTYRELLREVREDDEIKAVVLRINSPGGSAIASEIIWREINLLKEKKPVVVSMGNYAASGGYMMACGATKIFAQQNTLTGSIGVFLILPELSGFMNQKLGITTDTVLTGAFADFPSVTRAARPDEASLLQAGVDSTYMDFKKLVAAGRNMQIDQVESVAKGRVWLGAKALELGLVDTLGGLNDAIAEAAKLAGLETYRTTEFPKQESGIWEQMFIALSEENTAESVMAEWQFLLAPYLQVKQYLEHPVMRMELPYQIDIK